eukprot:TRINITY_DN851_c0_g1_i1.p1 TRINITY_DN851_c0_g1~~TRINITY_DN851_c0_g1_i1.p1  ORF type:complete len:765 (+),score=233.68 TRINITY_DN851_c0_g1_i1:318-2297(+)
MFNEGKVDYFVLLLSKEDLVCNWYNENSFLRDPRIIAKFIPTLDPLKHISFNLSVMDPLDTAESTEFQTFRVKKKKAGTTDKKKTKKPSKASIDTKLSSISSPTNKNTNTPKDIHDTVQRTETLQSKQEKPLDTSVSTSEAMTTVPPVSNASTDSVPNQDSQSNTTNTLQNTTVNNNNSNTTSFNKDEVMSPSHQSQEDIQSSNKEKDPSVHNSTENDPSPTTLASDLPNDKQDADDSKGVDESKQNEVFEINVVVDQSHLESGNYSESKNDEEVSNDTTKIKLDTINQIDVILDDHNVSTPDDSISPIDIATLHPITVNSNDESSPSHEINEKNIEIKVDNNLQTKLDVLSIVDIEVKNAVEEPDTSNATELKASSTGDAKSYTYTTTNQTEVETMDESTPTTIIQGEHDGVAEKVVGEEEGVISSNGSVPTTNPSKELEKNVEQTMVVSLDGTIDDKVKTPDDVVTTETETVNTVKEVETKETVDVLVDVKEESDDDIDRIVDTRKVPDESKKDVTEQVEAIAEVKKNENENENEKVISTQTEEDAEDENKKEKEEKESEKKEKEEEKEEKEENGSKQLFEIDVDPRHQSPNSENSSVLQTESVAPVHATDSSKELESELKQKQLKLLEENLIKEKELYQIQWEKAQQEIHRLKQGK